MSSALADVRGVLGDRYDVAEVAGVGGMATVYRATRLADGLDVAIKVLDPRLHQALGPDRFLREIAILSKLHHPGILPLLDSGVRGDCLYFVMPFVASTVRERLRAEPQLAIEEALRIGRAVLAPPAGWRGWHHCRGGYFYVGVGSWLGLECCA